MIHLLLWHTTTHAAALEQSALGGLFGSPAISSPHSAWWNPAMLPSNTTSFLIGGGFQYGRLKLITDQKTYEYNGSGPMAHAGAVTQISRFQIGFSSGVPYSLAGQSQQEPDYFLNSARLLIAAHSLAVASNISNWRLGIGMTMYQASWRSDIRSDGLYDYAQTLQATGLQPDYTDAQVMQSDYAIDIGIDGQDIGFGYTIGITQTLNNWVWGASLNLAPTLTLEGPATLTFQCPPESDIIANENAEDLGLCNSTLNGDSRHSLPLPHRIQFAAHRQSPENHDFQIAFGTVRWERYTNFELELSDFSSDSEAQNFIEKPRPWARDLQPSYWLQVGHDHQHQFLRSQYRLAFETPSVPKTTLTPNNSDAFLLSGRGGISRTHTMHNTHKWTIGVSGCLSYRLPRQSDPSVFSLSIENPVLESRYRWPNSAGQYTGFVAGVDAFLSYNLSP